MASLADLQPADKAKVSNLLRELARAQRDGKQASDARDEYQSRLQKLRAQNNTIVQETTELRSKFRHSLQLLGVPADAQQPRRPRADGADRWQRQQPRADSGAGGAGR